MIAVDQNTLNANTLDEEEEEKEPKDISITTEVAGIDTLF